MKLLYTFVSNLFFLITPIYFKLRISNNKEHPTRFKEKLSITKIKRSNGRVIWFHAASVGEIKSIIPLINKILDLKNINKILITTTTLSSAEIVKKQLNKKKIIHQFLPLDINHIVKKFLNFWKPEAAIFVDSEIWPNFIYEIKKKKIKLILINGRITNKTFNRWLKLKSFAYNIFSAFDLCIVSNLKSKKYLKQLGSKNIKYYGNLKFSNLKFHKNKDDQFFKKKNIWCAASTHSGEEIYCANVHLKLKDKIKNLITIIIPRHIHRNEEIKNLLSNLNLKVKIINKIKDIKILSKDSIYLVNTYGDAEKYFKLSKSVFLGGSIINHGGQNPIEPAKLGCKIYHGPSISNFNEVYNELKKYNISNKVDASYQLFNHLLEDFKSKSKKNVKIKNNLNKYGKNILNNVLKEVKNYI